MGQGFGYDVIARSKATGKVVKRMRTTTLKKAIEVKKELLKRKRVGRVIIRDLTK